MQRQVFPGGRQLRKNLSGLRRMCVGCGKNEVIGPRYCNRCRSLVARDLPVDIDDVPGYEDSKSAWSTATVPRR